MVDFIKPCDSNYFNNAFKIVIYSSKYGDIYNNVSFIQFQWFRILFSCMYVYIYLIEYIYFIITTMFMDICDLYYILQLSCT